jgi:hypothetical protein
MNETQATDRMRQAIRRQHKALATEDAYDRVKSSLGEDLEQFGRMAFVRAADCTGVIRRFHELRRRSEDAGKHPDYGLVEEVYRWMFVPLSVWPMDLRGLCAHLVEVVASGERVDEGTRMLCSFGQLKHVSCDFLARVFFHGWRNGIRAKFGDIRCRKRRRERRDTEALLMCRQCHANA